MATIFIDNKPFQVDPEENLLHQCLSLGFDLPYFCWHPAMGSVGACRQCAVKQFRDEEDAHGRLVMACMTPAAEGTRISIIDPEARAFRAGVIEWLMLNHPHDCPICDEGGECHLQDMTVMTGHDYRHTRFKKRTHLNQYLGPFINHEMNRCIQCYRCVRFYRDYAGGRDFDVFASRDHVYFGRHEEGVLENEFSGNLVEVCPTGVFTDKSLKRHYTRKWDLQLAPSVCVHCSLGCNISPGERYGLLRRVLNRYNGEVNGYFICDRGRYGYEFVNGDRRIRIPLVREQRGAELRAAAKEEALGKLAPLLGSGTRVIGIGSPRASLEANFALRQLTGAARFCSGLSNEEAVLTKAAIEIMRQGPARTASLHDAELSDAVLVLGEDLTNTAPRLALALRQAVRQKPMEIADSLRIPRWHDAAVREAVLDARGPLFIAAPSATRLDDVATMVWRAAPDDIACLGFAVAHALNPAAPEVPGLSPEISSMAADVAAFLASARNPLIVSGTSLGNLNLIQAAADVASALWGKVHGDGRAAGISFVFPECNTVGLALMEAGGLDDALQVVEQGAADTVIILENDLCRRVDPDRIDRIFSRAKTVVAIDSVSNPTNLRADMVLPAGTFVESEGTLVNNEGRAQRFFRVTPPGGDVLESWRWVREIMIAAGKLPTDAWQGLDEVIAAMSEALPALSRARDAAPPASFRRADQRIPRAPHRYSGRTALLANITVDEPAPPQDPDSPLSFSMEGFAGPPPPSLTPFFWSPGWNSVQSVMKFQEEVNGPLRGGDPGVRLIEPPQGGRPRYFGNIPAPFARRDGEWFLLPRYHIFGSEELSVLSPGIAERVPKPYLALNPSDADEMGASPGQEVEIAFGGETRRLSVVLDPSIPNGIGLLPAGLCGLSRIDLPAWAKVTKRLVTQDALHRKG
jgi:NADH-quinone oxidoreductase subunit G